MFCFRTTRIKSKTLQRCPRTRPRTKKQGTKSVLQFLFHRNCKLRDLRIMTLLSCLYLCTEYLNKFVVICKNMLILRYATRKYSGTSFSTSFASVLTFMHILPNNCNKIIVKSLRTLWPPFVLAKYFYLEMLMEVST